MLTRVNGDTTDLHKLWDKHCAKSFQKKLQPWETRACFSDKTLGAKSRAKLKHSNAIKIKKNIGFLINFRKYNNRNTVKNAENGISSTFRRTPNI